MIKFKDYESDINNIDFFDNLVLIKDNEYGTHVYYKHGYKNIELSYFTDFDELYNILKELNERIEEKNDK